MLERLAAALFVLIWSSGFIVARFAVPHAAPQLILLARMTLAALLLGGAAIIRRERWPVGRQIAHHLAAGSLLNGVFLCAGWWAISRGMPAGIMALLGALQPVVVAVASFVLLHERLPMCGWAGLGGAVGGVMMVLAPLLSSGLHATVPTYVIIVAVTSMFAMAAGAMIQTGSLAQDGMWTSVAIQNAGGAIVALIATVASNDYRWDDAPALWFSLAWSVLVLSAAGLSLLVWMTRHQGATRMSFLLLLVPPLVAIEAWSLFGEHLAVLQLLGFALALGAVAMARGSVTLPG